MLRHNKIHFSKPYYFNDPFELEGVRIRLSKKEKENITNHSVLQARRQGLHGLSRSEVSNLIRSNAQRQIDEIKKLDADKKTLLYRCAYISLSATNKEKLMWSHYAEAHFGVCLRFRGTEDEFYGRAEAGRILEIEYGDEVLVKEVGVDTGGEGYLTQASRKAACWEYEQEFRIFQIPSTRKADDAHGNHDFNSDLIDAVYFGVKTPERDKERVQEIIRKSGRQISTFQASRHPDRLDIIFEETET